MPVLLLLVGAVLVVAAFRDTQGQLFTALGQDVPRYLKWAVALIAVGALGYVPGMEELSNLLLALVIVVIVLTNFTKLASAFTTLSQNPPAASTAQATPAAAYAANPTARISPAVVTGTGGSSSSSSNPVSVAGAIVAPVIGFDPTTYLTAFQTGMGFGGIA